MAVLPIRLFPDPLLRKRAQRAAAHPALEKFVNDLSETLYAQPGGIGIAAPQVGRGERVIVIDVSPKDSSKEREVMLNPEILQAKGEVWTREGCMSLPDYTGNVKRSSRVFVEWIDPEGNRHRRWSDGIEAICLQHEIDHLNGILFIDRVASLKTDVLPRRRRG